MLFPSDLTEQISVCIVKFGDFQPGDRVNILKIKNYLNLYIKYDNPIIFIISPIIDTIPRLNRNRGKPAVNTIAP